MVVTQGLSSKQRKMGETINSDLDLVIDPKYLKLDPILVIISPDETQQIPP
jgi:hypothetical protein